MSCASPSFGDDWGAENSADWRAWALPGVVCGTPGSGHTVGWVGFRCQVCPDPESGPGGVADLCCQLALSCSGPLHVNDLPLLLGVTAHFQRSLLTATPALHLSLLICKAGVLMASGVIQGPWRPEACVGGVMLVLMCPRFPRVILGISPAQALTLSVPPWPMRFAGLQGPAGLQETAILRGLRRPSGAGVQPGKVGLTAPSCPGMLDFLWAVLLSHSATTSPRCPSVHGLSPLRILGHIFLSNPTLWLQPVLPHKLLEWAQGSVPRVPGLAWV
ncbi:hypothetical protein H1C71_028851 [Ictidomys tridecemlineatus]|nr:hypothetical protein H1C71_028851 [Ictidomys tridecemlineatus]